MAKKELTVDDFDTYGTNLDNCDCCYFKADCIIEKPDLVKELDNKFGDCAHEVFRGHIYELKRKRP